jgi:hypothetical protein
MPTLRTDRVELGRTLSRHQRRLQCGQIENRYAVQRWDCGHALFPKPPDIGREPPPPPGVHQPVCGSA